MQYLLSSMGVVGFPVSRDQLSSSLSFNSMKLVRNVCERECLPYAQLKLSPPGSSDHLAAFRELHAGLDTIPVRFINS